MKKRKIFEPKMIIRENKKRNKGEDHHFYRKKKMENTKEKCEKIITFRKKKMENTKGSQNWETLEIFLILATHKFICFGPGSRIAFFLSTVLGDSPTRFSTSIFFIIKTNLGH